MSGIAIHLVRDIYRPALAVQPPLPRPLPPPRPPLPFPRPPPPDHPPFPLPFKRPSCPCPRPPPEVVTFETERVIASLFLFKSTIWPT